MQSEIYKIMYKMGVFLVSIALILTFKINAIASLCNSNSGFDVLNNIWEDTVWTKDKSPYCIADDIRIINSTLTISPGVEVKFIKGNLNDSNAIFSLIIDDNAKIIARGTSSEKIIFTSNEDTPQLGDWNAILFTSSFIPTKLSESGEYIDGSYFENIVIKYAKGENGAIESKHLPFLKNNISFYEVKKGIVIQSTNQKIVSNINFINCKISYNLISGFHPQVMNNINFNNISSRSSLITFSSNSEFESLTISNSNFENISYQDCVYMNEPIDLYLINCNFLNLHDGAIFLRNSSAYVENTSFINLINSIAITGYGQTEDIIIKNSIFENNYRAIYWSGKNLTIQNSSIKNTMLYAVSGSENTVITDSSFINNYNSTDHELAAINAKNLTLTNCLIFKNNIGIQIENKGVIKNSTITYNNNSGIKNKGELEIKNSNIFGNLKKNIYNESPNDVNAINNYWGTTNFQTIKLNIYDKNDNIQCGLVHYQPFLNIFCEETPQIPPWCNVDPNFIDFGYVDTSNQSSLNQVSVSNSIITDLIIGNINVKPPFNILNNNCSNQVLNELNSCQLEFMLTPINKNRFVEDVIITSNSTNQPKITITGYSRIDEGFESGDYQALNWVNEGKWIIQNADSHTGVSCAQSPFPITDNQTSALYLTLTTGEGFMSFYYKKPSTGSFTFYVDGQVKHFFKTDWKLVSTFLSEGVHKFRWEFTSNKLIDQSYINIDTIIFPKEVTNQLISIDPNSYDFGKQRINVSIEKTISLININETQMFINETILTENSLAYEIINNKCSNCNLFPQEKCSLDIVFKASTIGVFSDYIKIIFNENQYNEIPLTGEIIGVNLLISGKIIYLFENDLELPISNANIRINDLDYSCVTDHDGNFKIQLNNVYPKKYNIIVTTVDFYKQIDIDISYDSQEKIDLGKIRMKCNNFKMSLFEIIQGLKALSGFK